MKRLTCEQARSLIAIEDDDARPDAAALRGHLATCDACAASAPELAFLLALEPPVAETVPFRPRMRASGLAAAALVIAFAASAWSGLVNDTVTTGEGASSEPRVASVFEPLESSAPMSSASVVHSIHGVASESVVTFEISSEPSRSRGRPAMEWISR